MFGDVLKTIREFYWLTVLFARSVQPDRMRQYLNMAKLWKHIGFRIGSTLFFAGISPFILLTSYFVSLTHRNNTGEINMLWLSLATGYASFILLLPIRLFWRILLGLLYLPLAGGALVLWSLFYVCEKFNDYL